MAQWEFYGRQAASRELADSLQIDPARCPPAERFFKAVGIGGRRGVGKNTLLNHVVQQHGWNDRLLVVRLEDIEGSLAERRAAFLQTLIDALEKNDMTDRLKGMKPRSPNYSDGAYMGRIIEHLLRQDIIVCLDEVHAILGTGMPTILAQLIDDLDNATIPMDKRARGQLVLMGSHQQKFGQLQNALAAMLDRFDVIKLKPWSLGTVMDMARAHGWDQRPGRFHTLWTAYDGMPREWERFARGAKTPVRLRQGWKPLSGDEDRDQADDQKWRREFVRHERHVLETQERRHWDNKAYVELPPALRDTIIWLGAHRDPQKLWTARQIATGVTKTARHARLTLDPPMPPAGDLAQDLHRLAQDTQIVEERNRFIGNLDGTLQHWQLNDNVILFQLAIAPDIFTPRYWRQPPGPLRLDSLVKRLEDLEGKSMERLTAAWLQGHPHRPGDDVVAGAERPTSRKRKGGDIDVLARLTHDADMSQGPQDLLILINAKRNGRDHKIDQFERLVASFLAPGPPRDEKEPDPMPEVTFVRDLPRILAFVSPTFRQADRERLQAAGHLVLDIDDMAIERRKNWPLLRQLLQQAAQAQPGQLMRLNQSEPEKPDQEADNTDLPKP